MKKEFKILLGSLNVLPNTEVKLLFLEREIFKKNKSLKSYYKVIEIYDTPEKFLKYLEENFNN